jgi:hypothetical protein
MSKKNETADEIEDREFKKSMREAKESLEKAFELTGSKPDGEYNKLFGFLEKENEPIKAETKTKPKTGLLARAWNATKNLFSSSSKNQSTKSNKVATSALKTQNNPQTKPEDLSKSRDALKQNYKQLTSLKHERENRPLTDTDRAQFTRNLKIIDNMTKEQLVTKSQEFSAAIQKELKIASDMTKVKDAYQAGAKIQSNLQKSIAGHVNKINQNTANYKGPNAALPNNKKSTGTGAGRS